jgi:transposase
MHLSVSKRSNGRTYLAIVKGYRDKDTKSMTSKIVQSIGYVDALEKDYPDPIAHFRKVAREMTEAENKRRKISLTIDIDESLPETAEGTRNLGYAIPLSVFHELELHKFLKKMRYGEEFKFNTTSIMILLVISRLLSPGSKKNAYENKGRYFERFAFSQDDMYRSLNNYDAISKELQRFLHNKVAEKFGSDTSIVYYDVTNYYFEIKKPDDFRKYGKPKQNRKKPVVQMGLAMDRDGVPLHYELFEGNKLDKETFRSVIGEVRKEYDTGRIIAVADMGIVTGDNIYYLVGENPERPRNGYVFSFSVRGGTNKFKQYVLDETDYLDANSGHVTDDADYKIKSRRIAREINVTMQNGSKKKVTVYEKQVVFWSQKYATKAKAERDEMISKAMDLISSPSKYTKATAYGATSYITNLKFDKNTGEVIDSGKQIELDEDKIGEEEKYDGYYSIVTSELHMSDDQIINTYRGLWEIEQSFKITKEDLTARPVYVSDPSHINAHFLTCFIALTILRLIQKRTGKQYSSSEILDCLNKIECMNEQENIYLFGYRSPLSDILSNTFGIDLTKKRLRLEDIKKIIGDTKK